MISKHGINRLLHDLKKLYYKISTLDLYKRINAFHREISTNEAPDIPTLLTNHIDKLTPINKSEQADADITTNSISFKTQASFVNAKQFSMQSGSIINEASDFIPQKIKYTEMKTSDQYMGEKLKDSTWSHIHTATLHVRQGDVVNANLHAKIANNALKEAAHYMSKEDYKVFCEEIVEVFNKLEK